MGERDSDSLTRRRDRETTDLPRWSNQTLHTAWDSRSSDDERTATRPEGSGAPWGSRGHAQRSPRSRADASRRVPRMPKSRRETQVRSPGITVAGTVLIVALTVLAFAGGRLFGRVTEEPTPPSQTAVQTPIAAAPEQPAQALVAPTAPVPQTPLPLPATFARAPMVCL